MSHFFFFLTEQFSAYQISKRCLGIWKHYWTLAGEPTFLILSKYWRLCYAQSSVTSVLIFLGLNFSLMVDEISTRLEKNTWNSQQVFIASSCRTGCRTLSNLSWKTLIFFFTVSRWHLCAVCKSVTCLYQFPKQLPLDPGHSSTSKYKLYKKTLPLITPWMIT